MHDGVGARLAERLDRLAVVGQVGLEHPVSAVGPGHGDVDGRHAVAVGAQAGHDRAAGLAARPRYADPLAHSFPLSLWLVALP